MNLSAAPAYIKRLELSHQGNYTILTIQGNDQIRIAHESVEARDGKPFRIVIDCLASRHLLPLKDFDKLPMSVIKSIRTSQYAVTPEEVVRVVMDLEKESIYRVEEKGNSIKVYVSDPKTSSFPQWASSTVEAQKKTSIKSSEKPVPVAIVAKTPSVLKKTAKPAAKPTPKKKPATVARTKKTDASKQTKTSATDIAKLPAPEKATLYGPVPSAKQKKAAPTDKAKVATPSTKKTELANAKQNTPAEKKQTAKPSATDQKLATKPGKSAQKVGSELSGKSADRARLFATLNPKSSNPPSPGPGIVASEGTKSQDVHKVAQTKTTPAKKDSAPPQVKKSAPVPPPAKEKTSPTLASVEKVTKSQPEKVKKDKAGKEEPQQKASRFRRDSARIAKLKATQVVQFPQRMVIKYKRSDSRDPFATLVDLETGSKGGIDLNKVPNVEALNLVGILESDLGKGSALMEDRDGIGYILKPGDRVRNGYVAQIDEQNIYFQVNEYGWTRTIVKHMEKEK
jgi:hypothetical protein